MTPPDPYCSNLPQCRTETVFRGLRKFMASQRLLLLTMLRPEDPLRSFSLFIRYVKINSLQSNPENILKLS